MPMGTTLCTLWRVQSCTRGDGERGGLRRVSCASCCNWQARGCAWATAGLLVAVGTAANGWVGPDIVGTHTVNVDGVGTLIVHSVSRRNIKVVGCEGLYVSAADVAASLVTKNSVYIDAESGIIPQCACARTCPHCGISPMTLAQVGMGPIYTQVN